MNTQGDETMSKHGKLTQRGRPMICVKITLSLCRSYDGTSDSVYIRRVSKSPPMTETSIEIPWYMNMNMNTVWYSPKDINIKLPSDDIFNFLGFIYSCPCRIGRLANMYIPKDGVNVADIYMRLNSGKTCSPTIHSTYMLPE